MQSRIPAEQEMESLRRGAHFPFFVRRFYRDCVDSQEAGCSPHQGMVPAFQSLHNRSAGAGIVLWLQPAHTFDISLNMLVASMFRNRAVAGSQGTLLVFRL